MEKWELALRQDADDGHDWTEFRSQVEGLGGV